MKLDLGRIGTVVGWGRTSEGGELPSIVNQVKVSNAIWFLEYIMTIYDNCRCQSCPSRNAEIKDTKVLELPHPCCVRVGLPWTHARATVEDRCCYPMALSISSSALCPGASVAAAKDIRVFTPE